ncbi:hypothetical protein G5B88_04515 [Herbaspirillum seropedicae]|uniref:Uncharacterized protein n=1 Tax=Herbaspirillum seropedicae (strain SmR1) TaxID=757424 RepID=D8J071_HERSS|nr:hypothetical protein [Herbaspirillum seropedicae]ADJ62408.1 phage-related hypothetical protein [Herbaspirillum seropedicae SmR1]AKN64542.1 hypothetical protein ACP92_04470 [Herbaspirillum seropedicae]NQE31038.1 hypothetical protein [Herbaspirillum seropedicae]UMU20479.1 hypothetical protein G5B88_04515 [Herbaspirillum seropedicae]
MSALADSVITGPMFFQAIPAEKAAALIFVPGLGWLEWVEVTGAGAFKGYRTLRCGALEFGTTTVPRSYEADLVGGLASKTAQASLWAWAQQNGHVVAAAAWTAKEFKFADVDDTYFRLPDLRNVGTRFTGTNADTAGVRGIGSFQADALQNITGSFKRSASSGGLVENNPATVTGAFGLGSGATPGPSADSGSYVPVIFDASRVARTATETRHANTAFAPRIHI